jgi:hypothetical protein
MDPNLARDEQDKAQPDGRDWDGGRDGEDVPCYTQIIRVRCCLMREENDESVGQILSDTEEKKQDIRNTLTDPKK